MESIVIQYCAVYGCYNTNETRPELTFFTISKEDSEKEVKFMEWSRYINPEHCKESSFIICEEHFNEDMIVVDGQQKILMPDALPVRRLRYTKPQQVSASRAVRLGQPQTMEVPIQQTRVLAGLPVTSMKPCVTGRLIPVKLIPASTLKPTVSSTPSSLPPRRLLPEIRIQNKANQLIQIRPMESSQQTGPANNPLKRKALAPEDSTTAALYSEGTLGSDSKNAQSTKTLVQTGSTRSISVQTTKPRVSAHHDYFSLCDRYLKGNLAETVKIQAKAGGTVTEDLKSFYMELYATSAEAYQFLQPTLSLPDPATLGLDPGTTVKLEEANLLEIMPPTSKQ